MSTSSVCPISEAVMNKVLKAPPFAIMCAIKPKTIGIAVPEISDDQPGLRESENIPKKVHMSASAYLNCFPGRCLAAVVRKLVNPTI